jgi:hypothetical protein
MTGTTIKVLGKYQEHLNFFPAIITKLEIIMQNTYQYDDNHSPENGKQPTPDTLCISNTIWTVGNIQHNKQMTAINLLIINDDMFIDSYVTHTLNTKQNRIIYHLHPNAKHLL